jgi:hypothetical protein
VTPATETAGTSYYFRSVSASGKTSASSTAHVVKIDRTQPVVSNEIKYQYYLQGTLDNILYILTGGMFFGTKIRVTVSANDTGTVSSGVNKIRYMLGGSWSDFEPAEGGSISFDIDAPYNGGLSIEATDNAGNVSQIVGITENFTIDTTVIGAPVVSVSPDHDGSS